MARIKWGIFEDADGNRHTAPADIATDEVVRGHVVDGSPCWCEPRWRPMTANPDDPRVVLIHHDRTVPGADVH